jgi:hypothetical protein
MLQFNHKDIERWFLWKAQIYIDLHVDYELFFHMNDSIGCYVNYRERYSEGYWYEVALPNKVPYYRNNINNLASCLFMNINWDIALDKTFARELHYVNKSPAARKPI